MAHRPYPSRIRALKQLDRHCYEMGPTPRRPLTDFEQQLRNGTATIVKAIDPMASSVTGDHGPWDRAYDLFRR
ncbi:hypothetical protein AB5J72_49870 [Streptomyces sp. CG1]|uniref:hypothetical protein n=1 Tax=Streptomyces sp. CG1 TaxID=1287523 RepID=UPI0034E1D806